MRVFIGILATICAYAQAPDARGIIRKSVDRDFYDFSKVKDYTYIEYDEKKAKKEQDEMDKELAKREHMSDHDKAKLEKERAEERAYLREIPDAFDFKIVGEDTVSGKPAWVIEATPIAGYKFKDSKAKILLKIHGKVWIDQSEYRWVKVEAEALDGFSFGLGLLKIEPGGSFTFEQTRVNDEVWLPSRVYFRGEARLAYVKKMRAEVEVTYRDYKKFQTDSRILPTPE
jgi:hypothetical protein